MHLGDAPGSRPGGRDLRLVERSGRDDHRVGVDRTVRGLEMEPAARPPLRVRRRTSVPAWTGAPMASAYPQRAATGRPSHEAVRIGPVVRVTGQRVVQLGVTRVKSSQRSCQPPPRVSRRSSTTCASGSLEVPAHDQAGLSGPDDHGLDRPWQRVVHLLLRCRVWGHDWPRSSRTRRLPFRSPERRRLRGRSFGPLASERSSIAHSNPAVDRKPFIWWARHRFAGAAVGIEQTASARPPGDRARSHAMP